MEWLRFLHRLGLAINKSVEVKSARRGRLVRILTKVWSYRAPCVVTVLGLGLASVWELIVDLDRKWE